MIFLLPVFGSQNVPTRLKAGFSFLLTIILFPLLPQDSFPQTSAVVVFVYYIFKEVFVGIVVGFAASFLFAAVQFAGRLIDMEMGFAMVELLDPFTDSPVTVSGQFQVLIFSILFLLMNGHYFLLIALRKSFHVLPLCSVHIPDESVVLHLVKMVGSIFEVAVQLAAPILTVLMLCSLALGVIARTVPQINIFFVGLPLKIGVGLITLIIVLSSLAMLFRSMVDRLIQDIWKLLNLLA